MTNAAMILVSAHVAAPHRFPNYFPQQWLQHVRDADCQSVLERRSKDGKIVTQLISTQPLARGYRHSILDVAALVINDVSAEDAVENFPVLTLEDEAENISAGAEVLIAGHRLIGESGSGTEAVLHVETSGEVSEVGISRGFVDTGAVDTEMGMCGGPIVLASDRRTCVGLLEGLVPRIGDNERVENELHRRVAGHSVFITARELRMFLHDVETEHSKTSCKTQQKG